MSFLAYVPGTGAWRDRRDRELCRKTARHIEEIVDGELAPDRRARLLSEHLGACEHCLGEADVVRQLKRAIARCAGDADPATVSKLEELARRLCAGEPDV